MSSSSSKKKAAGVFVIRVACSGSTENKKKRFCSGRRAGATYATIHDRQSSAAPPFDRPFVWKMHSPAAIFFPPKCLVFFVVVLFCV
jgi:hypothetical protein